VVVRVGIGQRRMVRSPFGSSSTGPVTWLPRWTGERSDGTYRQDARHEPLFATSSRWMEVQREGAGQRPFGKNCVQRLDYGKGRRN